MTLFRQPLDLQIIHMTEPLSAKCTVNPVVNVLVTRVPISRETSNGIVHSHIKIALFNIFDILISYYIMSEKSS